MIRPISLRLSALALTVAALLTACGGNDDPVVMPEESRPHDSRVFTTTAATTFDPMTAAAGDVTVMSTTSR